MLDDHSKPVMVQFSPIHPFLHLFTHIRKVQLCANITRTLLSGLSVLPKDTSAGGMPQLLIVNLPLSYESNVIFAACHVLHVPHHLPTQRVCPAQWFNLISHTDTGFFKTCIYSSIIPVVSHLHCAVSAPSPCRHRSVVSERSELLARLVWTSSTWDKQIKESAVCLCSERSELLLEVRFSWEKMTQLLALCIFLAFLQMWYLRSWQLQEQWNLNTSRFVDWQLELCSWEFDLNKSLSCCLVGLSF